MLAGRDQTQCGESVEVMITVNDLINAKGSKQGWSIDRCLEERGIYSLTVKSSTQLMVNLWRAHAREVWGIYDKTDYSCWEKDSIEKTHIHFCVMSLGV